MSTQLASLLQSALVALAVIASLCFLLKPRFQAVFGDRRRRVVKLADLPPAGSCRSGCKDCRGCS